MLNTYRRHDAVMVVCQNNQSKQIEIASINEQAQKITGYGLDEAIGRNLFELLDKPMQEHLRERVNFDDNQDDMADALSRMRSIKLRNRNGSLQEFRLRVVRSELIGNHPTFHLVLEDERITEKSDNFKQVLKENFKGHEVLEQQTGLPNRQSVMKDLEMFQFFAKKREATACFAVLQLDNAAQLSAMMGEQIPYQVLKHLGQLCAQRLRSEDAVGIISSRALGLILMQITPESARVVLNRLRWSAASMPVILDTSKRVEPQISIAFHMVGDESAEAIIIKCEDTVKAANPADNGALHEVKF